MRNVVRLALATLLCWPLWANAQSPVAPSTIISEIATKLPTNNTGRIDAKTLRGVLGDMVNSFVPLGLDKTANPWNLCVWGSATNCSTLANVDPATGNIKLVGTDVSFSSLNISVADQAITVTPFGSNVATTTSLALKGVAIQTNLRNFLQTNSMSCATDHGRDPNTPFVGCVTSMDDMESLPGSLSTWAYNSSNVLRSGWVVGGGHSAVNSEFNFNNFDQPIGNVLGDPSGEAVSAATLILTNIGSKITGAIGIGTQGVREFNRGLYAQPGTITQCTVCDYNSGATAVIDARGAHQYGFDAANMTGGGAVRINSGGVIASLNHAGLADFGLIGSDASDFVLVGQSSSGIKILADLVPFSDSTINLGSSVLRFANIVGAAVIADSFLVGTGSPVFGVSCPSGITAGTYRSISGITTHC